MANEQVVAVPTDRKHPLRIWLFNPFHLLAGWPALIFGVILILMAGGLSALSNSHFDGVVDFHTGLEAPLSFHLAAGIVDWLSLAAVLYIVGRIVSKSRFRAVDVFGTQALARWPMVIVALFALLPGYQATAVGLAEAAKSGLDSLSQVNIAPSFHVVVLVSGVMIVWMIALMWKAYSVACNARGIWAVIGFILGLLIAEVISKIVLWRLVIALGVEI